MTNWRTQLAVAVLAFTCSSANPQSLGDVARSERERRARMAHHAPMLTDEDLRRDQILKKSPRSDSALPSPDNSTTVDENLPLGDYARALRRSRTPEPARAASAVATGPAPEPQPTAANPIAREPQPAVAAADQKTTSLGDLAREVRAERETARRVRIQQKKATPPNLAQQKAAQQPAAEVSKSTVHADKTTHAAQAAHQTAHALPAATASPKPAQLAEVAAKPSAQPAVRPPQPKPAPLSSAQSPVQVSKNAAHANQAMPAAQAAPRTTHTAPTGTSVKPAQLTEVATKPSAQPAPKAPQQKLVPPNAAQPAAQAGTNAVHADKATHAAKAVHETAHTVPAVAAPVKPAQLTAVTAKPNVQPAPQPRAALEPEATDGQTIRVPRGASLWTLARTYLGAGRLWTALWKANPQIQNPDRIRAGQLLRCPVLDDQDNSTRSAGL